MFFEADWSWPRPTYSIGNVHLVTVFVLLYQNILLSSTVPVIEVQLLFNCLSSLKMSSVVYATPVFLETVRYNRKVEEDGADWQERNVAIYGHQHDIRDEQTDVQAELGGKILALIVNPLLCVAVLWTHLLDYVTGI